MGPDYKEGVLLPYHNRHISEAVYEFAPTSVPKWNDTTERQVRSKVAVEFSVREDISVSSASFEFGPTGVMSTANSASTKRTRMWNLDRSRMFQFGQDLCAFNALKPYTSYKQYLPEMRPFVEEYAGRFRPPSVRFLGQRYINEILLPEIAAEPSQYFRYYPKLDGLHIPFSMRIQVAEVVHGTCVASLAYQGLDVGARPRYVLDLYARTKDNPEVPFQWEEMQAWQDAAHQAIVEAFEGAITDRCRDILSSEL